MSLKVNTKKVFVIGLDCAAPRLLFDEFIEYLPNIKKMMEEGSFSLMRSITPPITIPAWMSMCTGKDAGELGVYGFRTRVENSYVDFDISTSSKFSHVAKIWDKLSEIGKKSILIGVPPTYPPYPINGHIISCFLSPDHTNYTYPKSLKTEIEKLVGKYIFDVSFRTKNKDKLIKDIWKMTEKRFKVIEYMLKNKEWDFFMFVEIGLDRVQHAFWQYYDKSHHLYKPGNKYKNVILDYYKLIDKKCGKLLSLLDENTCVLTVSDHGAKAMKGSFCLNEWLIDKGYLVLNKYPKEVTSFNKLDINWKKTKSWGWGGYYGRIFINKNGRETKGIVDENEYNILREELIRGLESEKDLEGNSLDTKVYKPDVFYRKAKGSLADLMVYFDDLNYRSAGTVGHKKIFLSVNDTGPDGAMHDWQGVSITYDLSKKTKVAAPKNLLQFYSTVLKIMDNKKNKS